MKTNISMKRFFFLLIGLTLSIYVNAQGRNFTFSGEFSQPNADGKIIYYGITDAIKRTVAVKSNVGNDYSGNIIIPSTVTNGGNTYTVTGIAKRAFQGCEVDSLYFPPSITEFEEFNQMFYNGRLDNIHLPENVAYIPDNCFWFTRMKKIWFSKGQRILGPFCLQFVGENPRFYGFAESNIEELRPQALAASSQEVYQDLAVLPKTIRILGHACFGYSPMPLDKVVIPPSMESIGTNVYNIAKDVYISHTMPFTLTSSSFGNQSTLKIHIPVDRSFAFKPVTGWSSYSDKIVEDLQIGPSGYTTFYLENENFKVPDGCTAYIITGVTPSGNIATPDNAIVKAFSAGKIIPKQTGFILQGTPNSTIVYQANVTGIEEDVTGNLLVGTATEREISGAGYKYYVLSNSGDQGLGFYKQGTRGGTSIKLKAHRAGLRLTESIARAKSFFIDFDAARENANVAGIRNIGQEAEGRDNVIYDLQGRRVKNPTHGIYIINGKKVIK